MSSFNTPTPSQPNNLPQFRLMGIPHEQKFRSMSDLMKITKPVRMPANSRLHHLPNIPGPKVPPKEKCRSMEDIMKTAKSAVTPHVYYSQLTCKMCGSGIKRRKCCCVTVVIMGFIWCVWDPLFLKCPQEAGFVMIAALPTQKVCITLLYIQAYILRYT